MNFRLLMNLLRDLVAIETRAINSRDYAKQERIEKLTYRIERKLEQIA